MGEISKWLHSREHGIVYPEATDIVMKRIYNTIKPTYNYDSISEYGSIFNFEFSPHGNVLVAACEKNAIMLFDSITMKKIHTNSKAHSMNVNCVKFLDNRLFATCSDDTTVALWDLRCLKAKLRSLQGHSNWVKNVEFSTKDKLLVTSSFDGSIFTWDINSHTEHGLIYQKVFSTSGLMRCRVSPDGTKMIISTTGGYIMIIHDLDLTTLHNDLCGFRPSIYRLMQSGRQYIPHAAKYSHVFSKSQKRNRVELVTDFPNGNDAELIIALQIHPQGNSFLSRNMSHDESTEWLCIHDLQEEIGDLEKKLVVKPSRKRKSMNDDSSQSSLRATEREASRMRHLLRFNAVRRVQLGRFTGGPSNTRAAHSNDSNRDAVINNPTVNIPAQPVARPERLVPDIWAAEVTFEDRALRQTRSGSSITGYNFVYAISSGVLPTIRTERSNAANDASNSNETPTTPPSPPPPPPTNNSRPNTPPLQVPVQLPLNEEENFRHGNSSKGSFVFDNPKKLMYYIEDSIDGKGIIKEPSYSSDGRIICSPYKNGLRLLAYNDNCTEYRPFNMALNGEREANKFVEIKNISSHSDVVYTAKFSPRQPLLVSGCRSGKVFWYYPRF